MLVLNKPPKALDSGRISLWIAYLFYNAMLVAGLFFLLPVLACLVAATVKRRHTFRQRMGWCRYPWQFGKGRPVDKCIWVHALSVGEVRAVQPLVTRLRDLYPDTRICLSTSTLTGFQMAGQLFSRQSEIGLAYFPYDWIWAVRKVASQINPYRVILAETDIWPNFLMEMHRRRIPVSLVNLRMSEGSWRRYRRFKRVAGCVFSGFEKIAVQSQKDLKRLTLLGLPPDKIAVTGNIKFDSIASISAADSAAQWKRDLGIAPGKRILMAGSTHAGEEKILLDVLGFLLNQDDALVLVLAPRDPVRSTEVITLCSQQGLSAGLLSSLLNKDPGTGCPTVIVVDSIGVLKALYSMADIVFVGGSLVSCGGHNPLEPAAWGKPVLFGPDMKDFPVISDLLLEAQAARRVKDADELGRIIKRLLTDPQCAQKMGRRGLRVVHSHRGAVDKTLKFLSLFPNGRD